MDGVRRFGPAAPDESIVHGAAAPGFGRRDPTAAVEAWVESTGRRPRDAVECGNATEAQLVALLSSLA